MNMLLTCRYQMSLAYCPSKQETERLERHFVEAWNKDFPWLVYECTCN